MHKKWYDLIDQDVEINDNNLWICPGNCGEVKDATKFLNEKHAAEELGDEKLNEFLD